MLFNIKRTTSAFNDDVVPCAGAEFRPCIRVDRRTSDDPRKIPHYGGRSEWWYRKGVNHRVEDGQICRDEPANRWVVVVPDLLDFARKHGRIIVTHNDPDLLPVLPTIEIYDGYRE